MAIDQTAKRQNLASDIVSAIDTMMTALETAQNRVNEASSSGVTFVDADFSTSGTMRHVSASNLGTAMSNITTLTAYLANNSIDDVFNLVRF